jgi:hypothetical protein
MNEKLVIEPTFIKFLDHENAQRRTRQLHDETQRRLTGISNKELTGE